MVIVAFMYYEQAKNMPQSSSMPLLRETSAGPSSLPTSLSAGNVEAVSAPKTWVAEEIDPPIRNMSCAELGPNFHPFSDTDISPPPRYSCGSLLAMIHTELLHLKCS